MADIDKESKQTSFGRYKPLPNGALTVNVDQSKIESDGLYSPSKTMKNKNQAVIEHIKTVIALIAFFFSGPCLIMTNRTILKDVGFPFPLTLSLFTLCFSSAFALLIVNIFNLELRHSGIVDMKFYMRTIMPIGALTGATIVMGMASYLFLTVSFVQMLKAFTPVMIMLLTIAFRMDNPTNQVSWILA